MRRLALVALVVSCSAPGADPAPAPAKPAAVAPAGTRAMPQHEPPPVEPFARQDLDSVRAALAVAWGREVDPNTCMEWPESFPRIVVVGDFASDRGCIPHGVFIDRDYVEKDYVPAALATRDFASASPSLKPGIAKAWVEEVSQVFEGRFIKEPTPAFALEGSPAFTLVRVSGATADITVEGWVREPSGMVDEEAYTFVTYVFSPTGELSITRGKHFAVPGDRLRAPADKPH